MADYGNFLIIAAVLVLLMFYLLVNIRKKRFLLNFLNRLEILPKAGKRGKGARPPRARRRRR